MSKKISLGAAFGISSPVKDLNQIPLDAICPMGDDTSVTPNPKWVFSLKSVRRVLRNIKKQKPVWIWGPSGCGKSAFVDEICARLQRPCFTIPFGEETSMKELLGSYVLRDGETVWQDGILTQALKTPKAIISLDEFNMSPTGVNSQFNKLLESGNIPIPETGEIVKMAPGVSFIATANTSGSSDETGLYAGSQNQNGATRNRFSGLKVKYMSPKEEEEILNRAFPNINSHLKTPEKTFTSLATSLAESIRNLVEEGAVSAPFSVRNLLNFADATLDFNDIQEGFADAYSDLLTPSELVPVAEVFHKVFGIKLN